MPNSYDIKKFFDKALEYIKHSVLSELAAIISEADERARNRGREESFHDITGNLRSSIGGAVYDDGRQFFVTSFDQVLSGSEGVSRGRSAVNALANQYQDAVVAVMVAAMPYAEEVEARDSKDVLESTRLWVESEINNRLKKAIDNAIAEINTWKL